MVNLKELVGGVGSDIDASGANDGEEDGRVEVLSSAGQLQDEVG
jgi:hypothetical protein